jgi:monoamine oxidase
MPRTPLASSLQDIAREAHISRRRFLGAAGAATVAATTWTPRARAAGTEKVGGVGAGLAGLTCAYRLKQAGVTASVFEASDRLGGRCWSITDAFPGLVAEHGGELIDTGHLELRQLCQELRLPLDNLLQGEQNGTQALYWFDGAPYTYAQAGQDFNGVYQKLHNDVSAASYPTTYSISTQRGRELDNMSIIDWINESVPGGIRSKFGQLLDVAYNIEYGAECSEQSSLNLLYLLGYRGQGQVRLFGPSDEKYHVRGGNDRVTSALGAALAGQITRQRELVAIVRKADGRYTLTFKDGLTTFTEAADRLVLALPFSILRSSVDYSKAGFSTLKQTAIRELGMGTNSKLHVGFSTRHWRTLGNNGETYSDRGYQNTWEVSRGQPGAAGILVDYTGGKIGASFGSGTPDSRAKTFLAQIEPVLPGITKAYNGRAAIDFWSDNKWTKGSYSYYKVGQYQRFGTAESDIANGNCHFCGEHTTQDFQGYLNGAVFTGMRVASEVLKPPK